MSAERTWTCYNCAYSNVYNPHNNVCLICGTRINDDEGSDEIKQLANILVEGYLKQTGRMNISTEIKDIEKRREIEESHIKTIILTFGFVRKWENQQNNQNYHIPPVITRMISDYAKKVYEPKKIGDLLSTFL